MSAVDKRADKFALVGTHKLFQEGHHPVNPFVRPLLSFCLLPYSWNVLLGAQAEKLFQDILALEGPAGLWKGNRYAPLKGKKR